MMHTPQFLSQLILVTVLSLALGCGPGSAETASPTPSTPASALPSAVDEPPLPTISDDPVLTKVVELGLRHSEAEAHLRYLTKTIGPRLTSSHALMDAEVWARDQFAAYGLDARLERWGEFPVGFDRGPASGAMLSPERVALDFTTPAWMPGVFGPARGPAARWPEDEKQLRRDKDRYRGAWVVVPRALEDRSKRMSEAKRERIELELRELGVLGYVSADRDERGELVHTSGRHDISWAALPADVHIRLRGDQHEDLLARLDEGVAVELEFSIDNRFFRGPVGLHNVVADLVGSELPDEFVIIGGHIDSWDGAEGAVDNATGVATTLEAARLLTLAGAKPRRTIRFMLWSGEEQGLYGSEAYVEAHPELMDKISAVFVHDGGTNYLSSVAVTPEMHGVVSELLAPLTRLDPEHKPFEVRLTAHLQAGSSDHDSFLAVGVPGFFWHQAGRSNYSCMHHTQLDVLAAAIDEYQRHSAIVQAVTAYRLANADELLDRSNAIASRHRKLDAVHDWAKIEEVPARGRARAAGLSRGDVIVSVDGEAVSTSFRVRQLLNTGGAVKTLRVRRGEREFELELDFSDDPAELEAARVREERVTRFGGDIFERIAADEREDPMAASNDGCAGQLEALGGGD